MRLHYVQRLVETGGSPNGNVVLLKTSHLHMQRVYVKDATIKSNVQSGALPTKNLVSGVV